MNVCVYMDVFGGGVHAYVDVNASVGSCVLYLCWGGVYVYI